MKSLPVIQHRGPKLEADSREVAAFFEVQHESLMRLINDNLAAFESFGAVRFQTGKSNSGSDVVAELDSPISNREIKTRGGRREGAGRNEKFVWLSEPQVAFLLTLTRNTGRTTELKLAMIQRFQKAREALRPVDNILLSVPDEWRTVFNPDYYRALLRVYGAEYDPAKNKPQWVGAFTNRYVYEPLWNSLPAELKAKRKAIAEAEGTAEFIRLHRFLEENAKRALERHILAVTTLLEVAQSPEHFRELFAAKFQGETQLLMRIFGEKRRAA